MISRQTRRFASYHVRQLEAHDSIPRRAWHGFKYQRHFIECAHQSAKNKTRGDELRAQEFLTWEHHLTLMRNLSPLLLVLVLVTGCAALPPLPFILPSVSGQVPVLPVTSVSLAGRNYRIVKTNVVGTSRGFALLGLITVKPPDYTEAFAQLYQAGEVSAGKALALINVVQQSSAPYFILFSLPKITLRADVVEFVETLPPHEP